MYVNTNMEVSTQVSTDVSTQVNMEVNTDESTDVNTQVNEQINERNKHDDYYTSVIYGLKAAFGRENVVENDNYKILSNSIYYRYALISINGYSNQITLYIGYKNNYNLSKNYLKVKIGNAHAIFYVNCIESIIEYIKNYKNKTGPFEC